MGFRVDYGFTIVMVSSMKRGLTRMGKKLAKYNGPIIRMDRSVQKQRMRKGKRLDIRNGTGTVI